VRGLTDKGTFITGGSSGIGLETARRFLEEGARVHLCGLDEGEVTAAVTSLRPLGDVSGTAGDVSSEVEVTRLVNEAARELGAIDVLINNAGTASKAPFLDLAVEEWDRVVAVNLRGMFLVAQAVAKQMVERRAEGVIVNMASTNALGGEAEYAHYNASKGGVLQLTRTMAVELGTHGIRVNCLCPGFILTPLNEALEDDAFATAYLDHIPLGRLGRPEDVAAAFAFLASSDAAFIHGEALVVDGGQLAVM
jgi:NAD(P)-dependent dehydrogenase (short-subunit alcohol dehydrogenase family)